MNNKKKHWSHDAEPDTDNPNRFDGRCNSGISWSPETFEAQRVIGEKKAKVEALKLALDKQLDESSKVLISHEQQVTNMVDSIESLSDDKSNDDQRVRLKEALDNHTKAHSVAKAEEDDKVAKAQAEYDSAEEDLFKAARTQDKLEAVDVDAAKKAAAGQCP